MTDSAVAPLLEARGLHVWRGERHLLRGVAFSLAAGQLLQVVGPNGVGKSTLLRTACNLSPAEEGDVLWQGRSIRARRDDFNAQLAYLAHANAIKGDLTALENLRYELALRGSPPKQALFDALERLGIASCAMLPARSLSAGQRRRLALARIALANAKLWILDEPTTNLDAAGVQVTEGLMREHLAAGGAILTAAHHSLLAGHPAVRTLELAA